MTTGQALLAGALAGAVAATAVAVATGPDAPAHVVPERRVMVERPDGTHCRNGILLAPGGGTEPCSRRPEDTPVPYQNGWRVPGD